MGERPLSGRRYLLTNVDPAELRVPRELLSRGASLTLTCRSTKLAEQASATLRRGLKPDAWPQVEAWALDPCDLDSIRRFVRAFKRHHTSLHAIVHGSLSDPGEYHRPVSFPIGADQALCANHLAPFLLTQLMLPLLINSAPARIVLSTDFAHGAGDVSRLRGLSKGEEVAPPKRPSASAAVAMGSAAGQTGAAIASLVSGEARLALQASADASLSCMLHAMELHRR